MAITLAEAAIKFVGDQSGLRTELIKSEQTAERSARRIGDVINKQIADAATRAGKALSLRLTAPILALGTVMTRAAVKLDDAFSIIRRQTGATGRDLAALREDFRNVFGNVDESAEEVARVLSDLNTRLGLVGSGLRTTTRAFLDFADVTGTDAAEATREVTRLLNAMGLGAEQIPIVLDKLTAAAQRTGINASQLAALVTQAGPAFQALGFDLDRTIALLAQLERAGADPQQVVQGLNILFKQFAKGGVKDAAAAFNGFVQAVKDAPDLVTATGISFEIFGRQAMPIARAIRTGAFETDGLTTALRNSQGALRKTAEESERFGEKLGRLGNRLNLALAPLGDVILETFDHNLPTIERFIGALTNMANAFAGLPPGMQSSAIGILALLAALGPVLLLVGPLIKALALLKTAFIALGAIAATTAAIVSGPVALALLGTVAAVAAAAIAWSRNWLGIRDAVQGSSANIILALRSILPPLNLVLTGLELIARAVRLLRHEAAATRFPAEFRKRTIAEERRGEVAPTAPSAPRITPFTGLDTGGGAAQNKALQLALRMFDLITERDRLSTAEQIANLEKIRAKFAKTAEERLDLDIRIARLRNQLADEGEVRDDRARQIMAKDAEDADAALRMRVQRYNEAYNAAVRILAVEERNKELQEDRLAILEAEPRPRAFRDETVSLVDAARQRLEELSAARVRNIDLIQREISQLQIIAEQEGKREERATDEEQAAEARLNRLYAERDIQDRLLEIARLRVDDARALLDLTQLEHSLGLATAAQVDAARRQSLAALLAQLQTAKDLNATQAELVPILQQILSLQEDLIRGDFLKSWAQAIREVKAQTFDFLSSARQFFSDLTQGFASALRGFATEGKTILETLGNLARAVFDAIFTQITNNLAQKLTQLVTNFITSVIPGLGGGGLDTGLATATAITTSGMAAAAAITTSGISAATAITTSGVSVATAIATASAAMSAAIVAAGAAAAAAIAAAAGIKAILGVPGGQHGGLVTGPTLMALAEAGRPELVLPIPRGLNLQEMASTMRAVAAGGARGDTFNIYATVRNDEDIRRVGRSVADAVRMAKRGNHPLFRESR